MQTNAGCEKCEWLEDNKNLLKRFQDMVYHMPLICNTFNEDFEIIDCNQKALEVFEIGSKEEYLAKFYEMQPDFQPDGRPTTEKAKEYIKKAMEDGACHFDWVDKKLDGELIPTHTVLVRFDWKGKRYVVAFVIDRREFIKQHEAERKVKERMHALLNASPLACLVINDKLDLTDMNQEFKCLFHLQSDLISFQEFELLSPEYQPDGRLSKEKLAEMLHMAFETGRNSFEWLHRSRLAENIPCEVTIVRAEQESSPYLMCYINDLRSARKSAKMAERLNELEQIAYTDPLTGAYNRRYFMDRAEEAFSRTKAETEPFAIIMLDIDHFKAVNDSFGHPLGDEVLKILVSRIQNVIKKGTVFARFGGEEFIVMLPDVPKSIAEDVAWRINKAVESQIFSMSDLELSITVSCGVAAWVSGDGQLEDVIMQADKALYAAKAAGRNTVVGYS